MAVVAVHDVDDFSPFHHGGTVYAEILDHVGNWNPVYDTVNVDGRVTIHRNGCRTYSIRRNLRSRRNTKNARAAWNR